MLYHRSCIAYGWSNVRYHRSCEWSDYAHDLPQRAVRQHKGQEVVVRVDVRQERDIGFAKAGELARERVLEVGATDLVTLHIISQIRSYDAHHVM